MKYWFFKIKNQWKCIEDTCVFSNCAFMVIIYWTFNVKVILSIVLTRLVSKSFVIYFYDINFFRFYIQLTTNSMEPWFYNSSYKGFLIYFLCLFEKIYYKL